MSAKPLTDELVLLVETHWVAYMTHFYLLVVAFKLVDDHKNPARW